MTWLDTHCSTILIERTRKGNKTNTGTVSKAWNCFKGNIGETSERLGGAVMDFYERIDIALNWTEQYYLAQNTHDCVHSAGIQYDRAPYSIAARNQRLFQILISNLQ